MNLILDMVSGESGILSGLHNLDISLMCFVGFALHQAV